MNRGLFQSPLVQQMMGGSPSCWTMNSIISPTEQNFPLLSSSSSPSVYPQCPQPSSILPVTHWHDSQYLPESWSQLLLGGYVGEEEKHGLTPLQTRKIESWEDQLVSPQTAMADMKQEYYGSGYLHSHRNEEAQASKCTWSQILPAFSSRSCITTSFRNNMLDFSNKPERVDSRPDTSECNNTATGAVLKKARVQGSSPAQSTCKVRKEKLGDRITALHQLVSPFGKTDTASVLLEAIGYIRFLQSQIEVLSSPYLSNGSGTMKQPGHGERRCIFPEDPGQLLNESGMKKRGPPDQEGDDEPKKRDLRSRGLCLVPVSYILHVGSDTGGDYWSPTLHGAS